MPLADFPPVLKGLYVKALFHPKNKMEVVKMVFVETLKEARNLARDINGTYRKCSGGWLVMSWAEFNTWSKQK